ncbi:glycosyltransferase [Leucobacter viscericola]|uniref:Glycosyltransferase n=1 Tax=Leucobacter viscericola TaxID=2714935 RepID=A0A6G7XCD6_9MICO|nr:glycosyltransferase [Leucobacter viscericola]QIK62223.1 glycosyltransferase [Leucobacter viscericola]
MRYVLAIAALVISGVLLLLGIGQRTFLAGPAEISYPVQIKSETGYAAIDGKEFAKVPGQANVVVRGSEAFVSTGATRDVQGWLAPFAHAELSVDQNKEKVLSAHVAASSAAEDGEDMSPIDPRGSDLWLESRSIKNQGSGTEKETLRVPVALAEDQSVLIASNGVKPVPSDVSLVWVQDRTTPWAGPLLAAGGLFAVIGGLLYLFAVDHDRRGLGPRRGRRGPFQGIRNAFRRRNKKAGTVKSSVEPPVAPMRALRRGTIPALGLVVALGLSGCSASYWPDFSPQPTKTAPTKDSTTALPPVPVTEGQMDRIADQVSEVAGAGDDSLDAEALKPRFDGDALAQRTANYTIRKAIPDYGVVPPRITKDRLDYELVQTTDSWPRTMFMTVASESKDDANTQGKDESKEGSSPSLALILTQETPQENYLTSRVIALRGGISMPQAAPAEDGTALLSNDLESLELPPGEVGTAYANVLQNGKEAPEADSFDLTTDTLLDNYGLARAQKAQQESDAKGQTMKFSVQARQGDLEPVALSTGVGGALVATTVIEEQIVDSAGGRFKPQAAGAVTALSGLTGEQDVLVQEVAHQMLFFVPNKSEHKKIELLGVTSELVGARNSL